MDSYRDTSSSAHGQLYEIRSVVQNTLKIVHVFPVKYCENIGALGYIQ